MAKSHPNRALTIEQEAEACRLYQQGQSTTALGVLYRVTHNTIVKTLRRRGVPLRSRSERHKLGAAHLTINDGLTDTRRAVLRRRAAGVCWQCGKQPVAQPDAAKGSGHKLTPHSRKRVAVCAGCREKARLAANSRKQRGLCVECCRPHLSGRTRCPSCLAKCRERYQLLKAEVFAAYGGFRCACCGETEPTFLAIDHIDGSGGIARRAGEGVGSRFYTRLRRLGFPSGYQVLCHNCNFAKHVLGRCPHQRSKAALDSSLSTEETRLE